MNPARSVAAPVLGWSWFFGDSISWASRIGLLPSSCTTATARCVESAVVVGSGTREFHEDGVFLCSPDAATPEWGRASQRDLAEKTSAILCARHGFPGWIASIWSTSGIGPRRRCSAGSASARLPHRPPTASPTEASKVRIEANACLGGCLEPARVLPPS